MIEHFTDLLPIETVGDDRFVMSPTGGAFLFGGMTMAVALRAAAATVEGKVPKSFRCAFLAAGTGDASLEISVERTNDSRGFAGRRLELRQGERLIAVADATFHLPEEGDDWHGSTPIEARPPEDGDEHAVTLPSPIIEVRPAGTVARGEAERIHPYWARPIKPLDDPMLRACALLFTSDYLVIYSPFAPSSGTGVGVTARTLEHSVWFHRALGDGDWWCYDAQPLSVAGGRFVSRGAVHDADGDLLASFVQEGFIR